MCKMSLTRFLAILSAAKDLAERSDTGPGAGVRSCAALRTTEHENPEPAAWA